MLLALCRSDARDGLAVARAGSGGYPADMRRVSLQRWAVVFLLVTRLVFGEFAHAHDSGTGEHAFAGANTAEPSHCGDHPKHPTTPTAGHADDSASDTPDCCKAAKCACPCLHAPAAASVGYSVLAHVSEQTSSAGASGATPDRPFELFRPPA
jgi:hypothetical protein